MLLNKLPYQTTIPLIVAHLEAYYISEYSCCKSGHAPIVITGNTEGGKIWSHLHGSQNSATAFYTFVNQTFYICTDVMIFVLLLEIIV